MRANWRDVVGAKGNRSGFTLIELLVVVAIIAVLISILLPSLNAARRSAKATKCGANLAGVGKAMAGYLAENRATFPTSYLYLKQDGSYDILDQTDGRYGYLHWSYFLFNRGAAGVGAFQCPEMQKGGHARTNPGPRPEHWFPGQVDFGGSGQTKSSVEDKQAPFIAYAGNAAVFPRNKFTSDASGGQRVNRYVNESEIKNPGITILAGEYYKKWQTIAVNKGSGWESKAHRPINPFSSLSSGSDEYNASFNTPSFVYDPDSGSPYGLRKDQDIENEDGGQIDNKSIAEVNNIGRHHPGGSDKFGGAANFLYVDGHTSRRTIWQTMKQREWGDKYYAITGKSDVIDRYGELNKDDNK